MTTPRQTAAKMAEAAQAWLERLDDEQRLPAAYAELSDLGLSGLFRRTSVTFVQTDRSPSARAMGMR
jgi:hypothetical protein